MSCGMMSEIAVPVRPARLGPNVWHDSPAAAMATLEELEETAKLVATRSVPGSPLSEAQIEELRQTFSARW